MQNVWAKVLAKELETPGTFSFKTLDILKNMSKDDFILLEHMFTVQVDGAIFEGNAFKKHGLDWKKCLKLKELGLLNLDGTQNTFELKEKKAAVIIFTHNYTLFISNDTESVQKMTSQIYVLTSAALELESVVEYRYTDEFLFDFADDLKKNANEKIKIEVEKANNLYID